jgi:hypothetical protein
VASASRYCLNAESLQQSETTRATRTSPPYLYLPPLRPSLVAHSRCCCCSLASPALPAARCSSRQPLRPLAVSSHGLFFVRSQCLPSRLALTLTLTLTLALTPALTPTPRPSETDCNPLELWRCPHKEEARRPPQPMLRRILHLPRLHDPLPRHQLQVPHGMYAPALLRLCTSFLCLAPVAICFPLCCAKPCPEFSPRPTRPQLTPPSVLYHRRPKVPGQALQGKEAKGPAPAQQQQ